MKKLNLLDCTLRDGGYYNNWDFDESLVKKYLDTMSKSKIDIVEIGFRSDNSDNNFGAFAYSKDNYLKKLIKDNNFDIAVMVNAKDLIKLSENDFPLLFIKKKSIKS